MDASSNQVYLGPDDIIHNQYVDESTPEQIEATTELNRKIIRDLRKRRRPVLIMADFTQAGKQPAAIREAGVRALLALDYDRLAVFGEGPVVAHIVNLVARASGKIHKVRYFDSHVRALSFLEEPLS